MDDQYLFDQLFARLPDPPENYFTKFIQDSRTLKASGDEHARRVDEVWNSEYEHHFKDSLSRQGIIDLIIYIKVAAKKRYHRQ